MRCAVTQTPRTVMLLASLNLAGLTMMIASIAFVLGLCGYCLFRVLTLPPVDE